MCFQIGKITLCGRVNTDAKYSYSSKYGCKIKHNIINSIRKLRNYI